MGSVYDRNMDENIREMRKEQAVTAQKEGRKSSLILAAATLTLIVAIATLAATLLKT